MNKKEYGKLSTLIYDLTKPPGTSIDGDIEFYTQQLLPKSGLSLEAGVGTGRILIPLLKKGIDIIGVDISKEMLESCEKNLDKYQLKTDLYLSDLQDFKHSKKFESIIMPNGSFCLITDLEKVKKVLLNFKALLENSGQIYIDLIFPIGFMPGATHTSDYEIDTNTKVKLTNQSKEMDWENQITNSEFVYDLYKNDKSVETEVQSFKLKWYGINEFKNLLIELGYSDIEVIKNYHNSRLLNLKTITFIAKSVL